MDHPSNTKHRVVCLHYKCSLPLKVIDISYLQECINFEVKIGDKTCNFLSLYRSPSQTRDEFENFIKNVGLNLEHIANKNPFLIVVLVDFNARMQGWYQNDITTFEGCKIDIATSQFGLSQIIKEPTHILSNSASCIDSIFTSQPNLVMHSSVNPSLHPNCHHQIFSRKFNLTVFYLIKRAIELFDWEKSLSNLDVNKQVSVFNETIMNIFENFIPHKTITCRHYQQANTDLLKRAIQLFDWEKSLFNLDVNKQVSVFNETIMNIFENFIPHETITCNDKDPPWMNKQIKTLIAEKNALYKHLKGRMVNSKLLDKLDALQAKLQSSINFFQLKYYRKISKKII